MLLSSLLLVPILGILTIRKFIKNNLDNRLFFTPKTINNTFGLTGWVSSHGFNLETTFSVLIILELSGLGVQYIDDNQLYNSIITAHSFMVFFVLIFSLIRGFGSFLVPLGTPAIEFPCPHSFTNSLLKCVGSFKGWDKPIELTGVHKEWRRTRNRMTPNEQLSHIQSELDYEKDKQLTNPSIYTQQKVTALTNEFNNFRSGLQASQLQLPVVQPQTPVVQPQTPVVQPQTPVVQPQTPVVQQPQTQPQTQPQPPKHPSGWTPINWDPEKKMLVIITSFRLTAFSVIRSVIKNLTLLFNIIIRLLLPFFIIINIPLVIEIYNMLEEYFGSTVKVLFLCITCLINIMLKIRRIVKYTVLYEKFFSFAANHYSVLLLCLFILMISVALVYFCGPI